MTFEWDNSIPAVHITSGMPPIPYYISEKYPVGTLLGEGVYWSEPNYTFIDFSDGRINAVSLGPNRLFDYKITSKLIADQFVNVTGENDREFLIHHHYEKDDGTEFRDFVGVHRYEGLDSEGSPRFSLHYGAYVNLIDEFNLIFDSQLRNEITFSEVMRKVIVNRFDANDELVHVKTYQFQDGEFVVIDELSR